MRRPAFKALYALLTIGDQDTPPKWDRIVLLLSTAVTIGLVVLYVYGKSTGRL